MYNVHITRAFAGIFPSTISIPVRDFAAAVEHYKTALRAELVTTGTKVVLRSAYGFQFRVDQTTSLSPMASVRLELPSNVNRMTVAQAIGGSVPKRDRSGIVIHDRFGVTWTLA